MDIHSLLDQVKVWSDEYIRQLPEGRVVPDEASLDTLAELDFPLPEASTTPIEVLSLLQKIGAPNTVKTTGGRYFGFVTGGSLPASLAANWLAGTWDQNAAFPVYSPISAQIEAVTESWLLDVFGLPAQSAVGFVTGTTMANFSAVIAARHQLLKNQNWNAEAQGLIGAPPIRLIVGEEVHSSMLKALGMAGLGTATAIRVPADAQGRFRADLLPELDNSTLICLQAGNVNSGAIDPIGEICQNAQQAGAWVHVDGAFGLWAAASPSKAHLIEGLDLADSFSADLHKWLNVPYDSGVVICKDATILRSAMSINADYLPPASEREAYHYTPEMSRRARGIEAWAALYSLGKSGLVDLIDRCCDHAKLFADRLSQAGFDILNEVCLNQVLVSFGDEERTSQVLQAIQEDGTCWCGGTVWKSTKAMRISVSSWATTTEDVELCAKRMIEIANRVAV